MNRIPLILFFTPSHRIYFDRYLRPSFEKHLQNDFELRIIQDSQNGNGKFYNDGWTETTARKLRAIERELAALPDGNPAVFSDVDIVILGNFKTAIEEAMAGGALFAFQSDNKEHCSGFFAVRNCEETRAVLRRAADDCHDDDQRALNRQVHAAGVPVVSLSDRFSSTWRFTGGIWRGTKFPFPDSRGLLTFHANFTVGKILKLTLLEVFSHADASAVRRLYAYLILFMVTGAARSYGYIKRTAASIFLKLERIFHRALLFKPFTPVSTDSPATFRAKYFRSREPVKTEETVSRGLRSQPVSAGTEFYDIPLVTLIERNLLHAVRIKKPKSRAFSVCQHIKYRNAVPLLSEAGISALFTPHCDTRLSGIDLLPLPIVPVVHAESTVKKDLLYSFAGCDHPRILNEQGVWTANPVRTTILALPGTADVVIRSRHGWHFHQRQEKYEREYKDILERSRFSLCPRGTGPNTIRFWESLRAGSIPVLFSDHLLLPVVDGIDWHEAILWIDEHQAGSIDSVIRSVSSAEENLRRKACLEFYRLLAGAGCFTAIIRAWARGESRLFQEKDSGRHQDRLRAGM